MIGLPASFMLIVLGATAGVLLSLNGCGGASSSAAHSISTHVEHVVIIVQENRTPDNLFQDPVLISRHADIVQSGVNSKGQTIALSPVDLASNYDMSHYHAAFVAMCTGSRTETLPTSCTMNGADLVLPTCDPGGLPNCPPSPMPPNPQFAYVNPAEVQPYFKLAEQYAFSDRMFQTNQGPSFPAHQFLIAGTSAPTATSNLYVSENVLGGTAGCIAPPQTLVKVIDPSGSETSNPPIYPCFEHPTVTDLLDAKGISWRYYAPSAGSIWTGPDAIQHICQPQTQNGQLVCTGTDWNNVIVPTPGNPSRNQTQVLRDIANNQLAQVSWVIPGGQESDHADINDGSGPSWVAAVVNAIGKSPYWANTAIFITWDDWGGWYDHVAPKLANSYEYGFRVPLIVVSPYAKAAYISHVTHDFGSILKFVEETYGLGGLGYADGRADDLSDCFAFTQTPLPFQTVAAPLSAEHFLNDKRPQTDPDDD